jgi:hypothetical protein
MESEMTKQILVRTLIAGVIALGLSSAHAAQSKAHKTADDTQAWQAGAAKYEFKDPTKTTCKELVGAKAVYKPYVVAYLSGHHRHVENVTEGFKPVSVPVVVKACHAHGDKLVSDVIASIDTQSHPGKK